MGSRNNSALASLTATYTDSENEEEHSDDDGSPRTDESSSESVAIILIPAPAVTTPVKQMFDKKAKRLVSYKDDTVVSEDDDDDDDDDNQNISIYVEEAISMEISEEDIEPTKESTPSQSSIDKYAHYGFTLPPETKGKVPAELQDKILRLYDKMRTDNMDMNKVIQERKEFRNPSIYEKLIQFCDINELGTNYPPEIYDPHQWGAESFYEELAKAQKTDMAKRQKEKKEPAEKEKKEEDNKKSVSRKSKWDQPAKVLTGTAKPSNLPTTLTANVTGTKGTVISAFGSLPKKPANP